MEKDLINRARKKDVQAISEIVQKTQRKAIYFAYKVVNDEALAKDIVLQSYILAFQNLDQLMDDGMFEHWFGRKVSEQLLNQIEYEKNSSLNSSFYVDEEDRIEFDANVRNDKMPFKFESFMNVQKIQDTTQSVLNLLTEKQRLMLMMYYFENMSIFEIADIVGVSENAVKDNLAYARKKIMNTLSDANVKSMAFLSWFLNDQMSKMISCYVSVDTIVEAISCIPQQVGIYDNMSGILGWWLRKTAISKALIVVLSMTLMSFILGALSDSNYNTIVNATEKLDTLESFHIKGVQHTQNGDIDFDVYIKNTDDIDEYYAVATTTIPEEVGYYYVFHYKDNQCQKYITTTPVDLNSIDGSQFGEYLTPSTNGNNLVDCYILSSKSLYKEILTMQPDSYDIALLKAYGRLFSGDENLRIRAVDKVRVLDEENINEANFERDGDIKRIKYNLALWKTDNSNEIITEQKSDSSNMVEIRDGYITHLELNDPLDGGQYYYGSYLKMDFMDFVE